MAIADVHTEDARRAAEKGAKLAMKDAVRRGEHLPQRGNVFRRPPGVREDCEILTQTVVPGRWQPRNVFDEEGIAELAASIKAQGLINPPIVFFNERGEYELIAGERRWRAVQHLRIETLRVRCIEGTPEQLQAAAVIDNIQRADLSPADEGAAYERLIKELGISEAECARRTGKPRSYIQQRRAIANAAPEVKQAHAEGTITLTHARTIALAAPGDHKAQKKALASIVKRLAGGGQLSEGQTKAWAEDAVIKANQKALEALGWKVSPGHGSITLWADTERPRRWTGAEILEAVREGKRPAEGASPAGALLTRDEDQEVRAWGWYTLDMYKPWVGLGAYGGEARFMSADEARAELANLQARFAPMQERYAAAGWTLSKTEYRWEAWAAEGAYRRLMVWSEIESFIVEIEAGKVSGKPVGGQSTGPRKEPCEVCKRKVDARTYLDGKSRCGDCSKARHAEMQAEQAAVRTQLAEQLCCWLADAPDNALRMLVLASGGSNRLAIGVGYSPHVIEERLRAAAPDLLREVLLDRLATIVYESRGHDYGFAPPTAEELRAVAVGGDE